MMNTNLEDILEFVRTHYQEFADTSESGVSAYGRIILSLSQAGFYATPATVEVVIDSIQQGLVDVCVKQISVIHAYGTKMWDLREMSDEPMLVSQIPQWLKTNGFMKETDTYLASDWSVAWNSYWTRHAVVWSERADDTYFVFVSRGSAPTGEKYVLAEAVVPTTSLT